MRLTQKLGKLAVFVQALINTTGKSQIITDTIFTNEPGYALLDRFKKTSKHVKRFDALVGYFRFLS